ARDRLSCRRDRSARVRRSRAQLFVAKLARLVGQHDRYAVLDRISKAGGFRNQLLRLGGVGELALGHRADPGFEQLRIEARFGFWFDGCVAHWNVAPPSLPPEPAAAISINVVRRRARSARHEASSSACFSAASKGQIMASELTSTSPGARSIDD